jgi:hypothetical protein
MNLSKWIIKHSYLIAIIFLILAVLAFSPKYFSQWGRTMPEGIHFHGLTMTGWLLMLIAQSLLIKFNLNKLHRWLGLLSYVLAPLVFVAIVNLIYQQFARAPYLRPFYLYFLALVLVGAVAFAILYVLAIAYRMQSMVHARLMVATLFPLVTPVTDRLFSRYFPAIAEYMPRIDQVPILPTAGFIIADLVLLVLFIWDWKNKNNLFPFSAALIVLLSYHLSVFTLYRFDWWADFCMWFVSL